MQHGRRLGRGVDARIIATAHRDHDVFRRLVDLVTSKAFADRIGGGLRRAVSLFCFRQADDSSARSKDRLGHGDQIPF
jgi:hypothetical protein